MNAKVEEFIKNKKNEYLLSLGLVDESKTIIKKEYIGDIFIHGAKYDPDKRLYYISKEINGPIEITDEEYLEILKYAPIVEKKEDTPNNLSIKQERIQKKDSKWAKIIEKMAYVYLIGGIIISLIMLISASGFDSNSDLKYEFLGEGLRNIFIIGISFPFVIGLSKIVAAAERYLQE